MKTGDSGTPTSANTARDEAGRWLTKLARGLDRDEGPLLREWLTQPVNRKAILDSVSYWHGPDVRALLTQLLPEESKRSKHKRNRNVLVMALSAAAAVSFVVLFTTAMLDGRTLWSYFDGSHLTRTMVAPATYTTAAGETRDVKLPDGSVITLNESTRLSVTYSRPWREVRLEYGEARFNVARDPDWLFNVQAGKRDFQLRGSRFNMRMLTAEDLELTVADGAVKVLFATPRRPETEAQRSENLTYGEAIVQAHETAKVYPGFQSVHQIEASEAEARLAWQRG
jgi:transmembrane sensor